MKKIKHKLDIQQEIVHLSFETKLDAYKFKERVISARNTRVIQKPKSKKFSLKFNNNCNLK